MRSILFSIFFLFASVANAEFVTIKSGTANIRTGPGRDYPIKYTYVKSNIPVKVLNFFEDWYQIEDFDGDTGWVSKNLITRKAYAITKEDLFGYKDSNNKSNIVVKLDKKVIILVKKCKENLCYVQNGKYKFYVMRDLIWGVN